LASENSTAQKAGKIHSSSTIIMLALIFIFFRVSFLEYEESATVQYEKNLKQAIANSLDGKILARYFYLCYVFICEQ
jgi:hypothetical protein